MGANTPYGFKPAYTLHGGPPSMNKYKVGSCQVFIGEPVKLSSGRVSFAASTTDVPFGICNTRRPADSDASTATDFVWVYDDLKNTVFMAQTDSTNGLLLGDTNIGDLVDYTEGTTRTGDTVTGISKVTLLGNQSTHDNCRVVGLVRTPDNAWADHYIDVYVMFNVLAQVPDSSLVA